MIQFWNIGRRMNKEADRIARHVLEEDMNNRVVPGGIMDEDIDLPEAELESPCRRFINDGGSICRVEYGVCGRKECGGCFRRSGQWQEGVPFVAVIQQLRYVREFFQHLASYNSSEESTKKDHDGPSWGVDEVATCDGVCEVMALKKKGKNRFGFGCTIPSGAVVRAGPGEEWFAVQEGFPTTRRVSRSL